MPETFNFSPFRNVPETIPPEPMSGLTMNGWQFSSKPNIPYQKRFRIKLYGLRWYTVVGTELYDETTNPNFNARLLELFYQRHQTWNPFIFPHQHIGNLTCRFTAPLMLPAAPQGANGWLEGVEINLIHHNPGY